MKMSSTLQRKVQKNPTEQNIKAFQKIISGNKDFLATEESTKEKEKRKLSAVSHHHWYKYLKRKNQKRDPR